MNRVALIEGPGAEDVVDIANVSSGSEAAIGAGVAKSFLGGGEIGVTLCWAGLGLRLGLLASDVVEASVVTGGRYMASKGVLTASSSSSSSESEERPPSS
jgi:hypothetical protein